MSYSEELRGFIRAMTITEDVETAVHEVEPVVEEDVNEMDQLLEDLDNIAFKLLNNRLTEGKSSAYSEGFEECSMWMHGVISEIVHEYTIRKGSTDGK